MVADSEITADGWTILVNSATRLAPTQGVRAIDRRFLLIFLRARYNHGPLQHRPAVPEHRWASRPRWTASGPGGGC